MVVQLRKCCCCCGWNVRTCTIVIGVLSLVHSSIVFLIVLINAVLQGIIVTQAWSDSDSAHLITWLMALCVVILIFLLLKIIMDSILLVGASKKRPGMVKPWLVFSLIELVLDVLGGIVYIILINKISEGRCGFPCYFNMSPLLIYLSLRIYFILVVNSFHTQLITNFAENLAMPPMNGYEENEYHRVKNHDEFV